MKIINFVYTLKNLVHCKLLVVPLMIFVQGYGQSLGEGAASTSLNNYKAYERTIEQSQALTAIIIKVMRELYMHENYWKTQKLTPLAYFLSKDPTKWVYRKQEWQRIDSSIAFLESELQHHAYYLGLFKNIISEHETDSAYSEQKLIRLIELIEQFLSYYPHSTKVYRDNNQVETYTQRVDRNAYLISYYFKNARRAVAHCSEPNHFQRNWVSYFVGTTSLVAVGYFMYKNKSNLQSWAEKGIEGLKKYYYEHVSSPILNSLKSLFDRDREPFMVPEGVKASGDSLERVVRLYITEEKPDSLPAANDIVKMAKIGNLDFFKKEWDVVLQQMCNVKNKDTSDFKKVLFFVQNFHLVPKLLRLLDIEYHAKEFMATKFSLDGEKQFQANMINFEIAAALPSALLIYFSYTVGKFLFTKIVLQKNTYQPLRRSLRHLHMIYNVYATKDEHLSIVDHGFCYYWIEYFKKHSVQLALSERKMILDDLAQLESDSFNATQKLSIIQRMYYNYHFLLPSLD